MQAPLIHPPWLAELAMEHTAPAFLAVPPGSRQGAAEGAL